MDARPDMRLVAMPKEHKLPPTGRRPFERPRLIRYPELRRVTMASGLSGDESFF